MSSIGKEPRWAEDTPLTDSLEETHRWLKETFDHCHDLFIKEWRYGPEMKFAFISIYLQTMTSESDTSLVQATLNDLSPLLAGLDERLNPEKVAEFFGSAGVSTYQSDTLETYEEVARAITDGGFVLVVDGWNRAIRYPMHGMATRSISEPSMEPVVFGPHNSTIEDLKTNIGLLRGLLRTPKLKFESVRTGGSGRRQLIYGYVDGAVDKETLKQFKDRIDPVKNVEILETTYLEEWIEESVYSPFPQVRFTERPDVAVAALLEGKIVALVQGSPTLLICPGLFVEFFTSSEDYYQRTVFSTLIRWLRIIAFIIALTLPSLYIALTTFHPELIPTVLLQAILDTREKIPFPAVIEALLMEFFFELLREAGIRLPRPIGSAVSIVGALVIGQAAIQAKIASPIMVIVVALTGIASFAMPQYNFGIALRVLRFPLMLLAATLGGFGLMIGYVFILLHLINLNVLNQTYLAPLAPLRPHRLLRDVLLRQPLRSLLKPSRRRPFG